MEDSNISAGKIHIRSAHLLADVQSLSSCFCRSFSADPWWKYLYTPGASFSGISESRKALIDQEALVQCKATMKRFCLDPAHHTLVACDPLNGQILGFAGWVAPTNAKHHHRHLTLFERLYAISFRIYDRLAAFLVPHHLGFLLGFSSHARTIFLRQQKWANFLEEADKRYVRQKHIEQGFWRLAYCGVLPEYGRQGIGQNLLQWCTDKADEEDRAIYVSASLHGLGAYKKVGFKEIGRDICYPTDPQGGWPEIVCLRQRKSDREKEAS